MKISAKFIPFLSLAIFFPLVAFAQGVPSFDVFAVLVRISALFRVILPLLVALGVVYFVWGVVQYFINDSEEAKKKGKDRIIYGIIGLAVILSVWGLVYLITDFLGIGGQRAPDLTNLVVTTPPGFACEINPKLQGLLDYVTCIIGKSVVPFIFAIAIVMFIWGAIKFLIIDAGEEKKREEGKQFMLWGIIALAVMISIWGLVSILGNTFGIDPTFLPKVKP